MGDHKDVGGYKYTRPRGPIAAQYASPGPIYSLPTLVGKSGHDKRSTQNEAPAYSLGLKTDLSFKEKSPGPAAYDQNAQMTYRGRDGQPHYSLGQRTYNDKKRLLPGPADYAPEKNLHTVYPRQPAFTMAGRRKELTSNQTPGPGQYKVGDPYIEGHNARPPAFSMTARHDRVTNNDGPGPSAYNTENINVILPSGPKYTMSSKASGGEYRARIPGPGAYRNEDSEAQLNKTSGKTFGMKHSQYSGVFIVEPKNED